MAQCCLLAARHSAAFGTLPFPWYPDTLRQPGILRQPCTWGHGASAALIWCRQSAARFRGVDWPPGFCPAGMVPPIGGTVQPPYWAAQNGGGGVAPAEWRVQRTPNGVLSLPGLLVGLVSAWQLPGGVLSGGIPPDVMRGGASCRRLKPAGITPAFAGSVTGVSRRRVINSPAAWAAG